MQRPRRSGTFRFAPGAPGVLDAIAHGPAPEGLEATPPVRSAARDLFFDTGDGDLERRGAWVRVRHHPTGRRTLTVSPTAGPNASAPLAPGEPSFEGDSEPVRMLRAMVDPDRLVPRLDVATDRWLRRFTGPEGEVPVACERRRVRAGDLAAEVEEVLVPRGRGEVALALRHQHGLVRRRGAPLTTARAALAEAEVTALEEAVHSARQVAVLALEDGRIALLRHRGRLRVPSKVGAGEDACREALRTAPGTGEARVRLLGTAPGGAGEAAVEVWLAEGALPYGDDVVRLSLEEVLASVGSPSLRDRATLAALHVAARSGLPAEAAAGETDGEGYRALAALPEVDEDEGEPLPVGTLLNMELSLLAFNRRVLELAADPEIPLLERLRFLAIFGGNLDEFFRVRVAGFKRQVALESGKRTLDGVTPNQQLDAIGARARLLMGRAYALLRETLLPELAAHGTRVVPFAEAGKRAQEELRDLCQREIRPLLAPLTAGPGHPFPQVRNLRPALAALVAKPDGRQRRLGIVEIPDDVPRFLPLPGQEGFVAVEEVVRDVFPALYPGLHVEAPWVFRVTRSAELHLDQERVEDVLHAVEEQVRKRRFRPVVRLEVEAGTPDELRHAILRELRFEVPRRPAGLGEGDVYEVDGPLDLGGLSDLVGAAHAYSPALVYPPAPPPCEPLERARPLWEQLREREVLVSFPEDSFERTVERLVLDAAEDPEVVAIKLALYRTNPRSSIVEALTRAAAGGKQVFALVELTARFDEMHNIRWARYLRSYGIHVVFGFPGLKVHAKLALVVRREDGVPRRYGYVGTGNLNASTAALYTDLGLLTADPEILDDVSGVFDLLTGAAPGREFSSLIVAPGGMRSRFLELIAREAERGPEGRITVKVNGLADREMIAGLYDASRAGVPIDLLVRGICALRPGVPDLSETIHVYSRVGRYLEHSRLFRFGAGDRAEYWIGSGDWRTRNLSRRVEVAVPVREPEHRARLDGILARELERPDLWELGADGTYYQRPRRAPRGAPRTRGGRPILLTGGR